MIVEFKRLVALDPLYWQCNCGSFEFFLIQGGQIQCSHCETMHDDMKGEWSPPDEPSDEPSA